MVRKTVIFAIVWIVPLHGQVLVVDDRFCSETENFIYFFDTLRAYGADVRIGGPFDDADLLWIISPFDTVTAHATPGYLDSLRQFFYSGHPIFISLNCPTPHLMVNFIIDHLFNPPPVELIPLREDCPYFMLDTVYPSGNLLPILSINDTIIVAHNYASIKILTPWNTFPLLIENDTIYAVVSYPLWDGIVCGPPLIIMCGNHTWEGQFHLGESTFGHASIQFGKRLILSLLNCGGYYFRPCAVPEGFILGDTTYCNIIPNPFTPNNDGINDYCVFVFPNITLSPAVIRIYDIHSVLVKDIQVPLGWAAKSAARWYGKDNSGKPVPQGVYLYEIEQNGEVICTGTVTVAR